MTYQLRLYRPFYLLAPLLLLRSNFHFLIQKYLEPEKKMTIKRLVFTFFTFFSPQILIYDTVCKSLRILSNNMHYRR